MSPMSPSFGLQLPRKHQKMGMIPGSSMVEHSAVNYTAEHHKPLFWRRIATKLSPLVVPQLCPTIFANTGARHFLQPTTPFLDSFRLAGKPPTLQWNRPKES